MVNNNNNDDVTLIVRRVFGVRILHVHHPTRPMWRVRRRCWTVLILLFVSMMEIERTESIPASSSSILLPTHQRRRARETRSLRFLEYNIDEGGSRSLLEWIPSTDADVVGLLECNGWNETSMTEIRHDMGFPYATLFEISSGYHIGVLSRYPIETIAKREDGFERGALHVRIHIDPDVIVDVFVVHLTPHDASRRVEEARALVSMIRDVPESNPVVVMGDLNTLSPFDADRYDAENLLQYLRRDNERRLYNKLTHQDRLYYEPFHVLTSAGDMIDPCESATGIGCAPSEPTRVRPDQSSSSDQPKDVPGMRLDYVLFRNSSKIRDARCEVRREDPLSDLSDHYPLVCSCVVLPSVRAK